MNKCNTCFYAKMDKDLEAPCAGCTNYSNWVSRDVYKDLHDAVDSWFNNTNGITQEDFWYASATHDPVNKPKHYMLFEEQGIEVRDVLKKLATKLNSFSPMFIADYVQMMQYGMRFMDKNGLEDLKKQRWYLDKMIDAYDDDV